MRIDAYICHFITDLGNSINRYSCMLISPETRNPQRLHLNVTKLSGKRICQIFMQFKMLTKSRENKYTSYAKALSTLLNVT